MPATHYNYTPQELESVFQAIVTTMFDVPKDIADDGSPAPKILVVAGVQGSGKT